MKTTLKNLKKKYGKEIKKCGQGHAYPKPLIRAVVKLYKTGDYYITEIAEELGLKVGQISRWIAGKVNY